MTPGPISEVPGFDRQEPVEPAPEPRRAPLISSVPGMAAASAEPVDADAAAVSMTTQPYALPPVEQVQLQVPPPPPPPDPLADTPPTPSPATAATDDVDATRRVDRPALLVLTWDDGTVLELAAPTVIGRDPVGAAGDLARGLADASLSLSKTHARLVPGLSPTIEDLHSTNGVRIDRAGQAVDVPPGTPTALRTGDRVVCGMRTAAVEVRL